MLMKGVPNQLRNLDSFRNHSKVSQDLHWVVEYPGFCYRDHEIKTFMGLRIFSRKILIGQLSYEKKSCLFRVCRRLYSLMNHYKDLY